MLSPLCQPRQSHTRTLYGYTERTGHGSSVLIVDKDPVGSEIVVRCVQAGLLHPEYLAFWRLKNGKVR